MEVLVFTTSVLKPEQVSRVSPLLTAIPAIKEWDFDLEDCDHILRVVTRSISPGLIESLLKKAGFDCAELEC